MESSKTDNGADLLANGQSGFMDALQKGPDHLPSNLFSGSRYRAFIGVKAHANTISHARLVALEDTYPRLRERLGDEAFNQLSRDYLEYGDVRQNDMNGLGREFAEFIDAQGVDKASSDLAHIEWAWLKSYHAADAEALNMQDIAALDEAALMELPIAFHPSVQHIMLHAPLAPELGLEVPADDHLAAIAIVRQQNDVLLFPQTTLQKDIFICCKNSVLMRNLLESAVETIGETHAVEHIFALVGAGFLKRSDNEQN
jgi:hypothetical protein